MEPIVPIVNTAKSTAPVARGTLADLLACLIAAISALVAFTYSAIFFIRFLENDTYLWGVVSAFLLCFGVGAFGYIPTGITSFIAWKAYKQGAEKSGLLLSLFLCLPWCVLALILTFISDMPKVYSLPILITAVILTAWALISLRKIKSR